LVLASLSIFYPNGKRQTVEDSGTEYGLDASMTVVHGFSNTNSLTEDKERNFRHGPVDNDTHAGCILAVREILNMDR
jgi:hypothetical protein